MPRHGVHHDGIRQNAGPATVGGLCWRYWFDMWPKRNMPPISTVWHGNGSALAAWIPLTGGAFTPVCE